MTDMEKLKEAKSGQLSTIWIPNYSESDIEGRGDIGRDPPCQRV